MTTSDNRLHDHSASEVDSAKREVLRAERMLSNRLHEAGVAGQKTLTKAISVARPVIIGVVVVAGVAWMISMLRRPRNRGFLSAPARPSVLGEVVRAAALSLASTAARRVGDHFLLAAGAAQSISPGRAGAPHSAPT